MKSLSTLFLSLIPLFFTYTQTLPEKIALGACEYLDSINDLQTLVDSIDGSLSEACWKLLQEPNSKEERQVIGNVYELRRVLKEAKEILPLMCENVKRLILEEKKKNFYKKSEIEEANTHFEKGTEYLYAGEYEDAEREFLAAIVLDENFILALDQLAISYRRQEKFEPAIYYYNKSLEIFPEGEVALLNIGHAYLLVNDIDKAINSFGYFRFLYPEDPEGYFGLGQAYFLKEDFAAALDNLFPAYIMYTKLNSDLIRDAEMTINLIYAKLVETNKKGLFRKKAREYGVDLKFNQ